MRLNVGGPTWGRSRREGLGGKAQGRMDYSSIGLGGG